MASYPTLHPDHPLPDVDEPIGRPFWEHCRRHELFIQKSRSSGQFVFPPRPHYAGDFEWRRVSGRGRVLTFVIVRPPFLPAAFFCAVVPPWDELERDKPDWDAFPPRLEAPGELAIFAARSLDMPLSLRASYCFSFFTCADFDGTTSSSPHRSH